MSVPESSSSWCSSERRSRASTSCSSENAICPQVKTSPGCSSHSPETGVPFKSVPKRLPASERKQRPSRTIKRACCLDMLFTLTTMSHIGARPMTVGTDLETDVSKDAGAVGEGDAEQRTLFGIGSATAAVRTDDGKARALFKCRRDFLEHVGARSEWQELRLRTDGQPVAVALEKAERATVHTHNGYHRAGGSDPLRLPGSRVKDGDHLAIRQRFRRRVGSLRRRRHKRRLVQSQPDVTLARSFRSRKPERERARRQSPETPTSSARQAQVRALA